MVETEANRRYLEWLESSCFNIVRDHLGLPEEELVARAVGIVKLHALFGGRIVIDSMGLIGSQVLLTLFSDSEFRRFLATNPDFVKLVAVYRESEDLRTRREIVTSSLVRATQADWVSSTFPVEEPVARLSGILLETEDIDPGLLLSETGKGSVGELIERWSTCKHYLEGLVYSVAHFANNIDTPVARGELSSRVYDILRETAERPDISPKHQKLLKNTMQFIETEFESPNLVSHSQIIAAARSRLKHDPRERIVLQTASHAFNAGIVRSVDPDYGSYEFFPHGTPVGLYLDSLRDVLVPTKEVTASGSLIFQLRRCEFDWEPRHITWPEIEKISIESDAVATAKEFQAALRTGDSEEIHDSIERHLSRICRLLVPQSRFVPEPWMWVIGGVVVLVGLAGGGLPGAATGATIASVGIEVAEAWIRSGRRYVAAETLRQRAEKMVPRPHGGNEDA